MEKSLSKNIVDRIMKGELDEELAIAQKDQDNDNLRGFNVKIDKDLMEKVDDIFRKKGYSFEAFISVCVSEYLKTQDRRTNGKGII